MALRLEIVSRHRQGLGERSVKEFGRDGGTIGRSLDCDWALPDGNRYLSSRHASIDYHSGSYYVVDTSTNGVFVNDSDTPVGKGNPQRLFNGDRIRIGEYEFAVEIDGEDDLSAGLHVDPVKLAERVPPPDPTRADLLQPHEIAPLGIAMLVDEQADSERIRIAQQRSSELSLVEDPPPPRHVPTPLADEAPKAPPRAEASKPAAENAAAKRAGGPPPVSAAAHVLPKAAAKPVAAKPVAPKPAATQPAATQPAAAQPAAVQPAATQPAAAKPAAAKPAAAKAAAIDTATPKAAAQSSAAQPARTPSAAKPATPPGAAAATRAPGARPAAASTPPPQRKAAVNTAPSSGAAAGGTAAAVAAFFRGAGIAGEQLSDAQATELMHRLGQLVRETIVGLNDNLHVRADQKSTLRVPSTTIQPRLNNPLKFSAGVDEALRNLLLRQPAEYLTAVEAVREAFRDVKVHQQSLLAALRTAIGDYLSRLDPEDIESKYNGAKRGAIISAANKLRYWDLYKDLYQVVTQAPPGQLPQLLVDDLLRAYEREAAKAGPHAKKPHAQAG